MNGELALRFGRGHHLVGIAGFPTSPPGDVGVIVLNAGLVHRVGPFRLHVELTRALNQLGYTTLRMDLSTLGDSGATGESGSQSEQVRADIRDAMDQLRAQGGCTRFVLAGLCSGAENAFLAASSEQDVAGAILIDGYAYRTPGFYLRRYLPRALNPFRVIRFISRKIHTAPIQSEARFAVEFPPRSAVSEQLQRMLDGGMKLLFVFSGGASSYFNHLRQFRECYGPIAKHPGTTVYYLADSDHTFILAGDRKELIDMIGGWITCALPVGSGGSNP